MRYADLEWIRSLSRVSVLSYYDRPLISLMIDSDGDLWMEHWCDQCESHETWMYYWVSNYCVRQLLSGGIPLLDAILKSPKVHLIDVGQDGEPGHYRCINPRALPDTYLPEPDAMLCRTDCCL